MNFLYDMLSEGKLQTKKGVHFVIRLCILYVFLSCLLYFPIFLSFDFCFFLFALCVCFNLFLL